jgi:hypothetical protein
MISMLFVFVCLKKNCFVKEKPEKRKQKNSACNGITHQKERGISPEGWSGEERANPLCRTFWLARGDANFAFRFSRLSLQNGSTKRN